MALSESQRVAYGGTKSGSNAQPHRSPSPPEDFLTDLSASSLSKQNSIFSLTLGEIQDWEECWVHGHGCFPSQHVE
ncbi:hypothetical protein SLA2020_363990 [Shorea laevis]